MARKYDNTDTDNDLISDWKNTGLFNDRVIKSHRAPQMSLSRKAIVSVASIFMMTTTGMVVNSYTSRHNARIIHARVNDHELTSIDDVMRQLRVDVPSRSSMRARRPRTSPFTTAHVVTDPRPMGDVQRHKRTLSLPQYHNYL